MFRLWVANSGKKAAQRVQVFARQLLRRHANGDFRSETRFLPMNLLWSHGVGVTLEGLACGTGHHCDLGYIFPPRRQIETSIGRPESLRAKRAYNLRLRSDPSPAQRISNLQPIAWNSVLPERTQDRSMLSLKFSSRESGTMTRPTCYHAELDCEFCE